MEICPGGGGGGGGEEGRKVKETAFRMLYIFPTQMMSTIQRK